MYKKNIFIITCKSRNPVSTISLNKISDTHSLKIIIFCRFGSDLSLRESQNHSQLSKQTLETETPLHTFLSSHHSQLINTYTQRHFLCYSFQVFISIPTCYQKYGTNETTRILSWYEFNLDHISHQEWLKDFWDNNLLSSLITPKLNFSIKTKNIYLKRIHY